MKIKYKILKGIDIVGLQFLDPVIRFCYGEEPELQLRRIVQFIVVPVVAFLGFLLLWNWMAPRHTTKSGEVPTTKSGEVPTPKVVWSAGQGVLTFHEREQAKKRAFTLNDDEAAFAIKDTKSALQEIETESIPAIEKQITALSTDENRWKAREILPFKNKLESQEALFKEDSKLRKNKLEEQARSISKNDVEARKQLLDTMREHETLVAMEKEQLNRAKAELSLIERKQYPPMRELLNRKTRLEEQKQFLTSYLKILENRRETKIANYKEKLDQEYSAFIASEPEKAYSAARKVIRTETRIKNTETASYSEAKSLPYQTFRSLLCVFAGFILASIIAIPIGILCGLSKTFMAGVTLFIAVFKPVSPIVWLPIALIVVGGFIPDPENNALLGTFDNIWPFTLFAINPAFLASAVTVALCSLWPTLVNTALGVASIDKDHLNVARVLRLGFWDRLIKIVIPSALPLIFTGLRISLGVGWMVLIAAELLSSSEGIGKFVWDMFNNGSSDSFAQMFVVVFLVGIIGLMLDRIMIVFQRLVSFDGAPTAL